MKIFRTAIILSVLLAVLGGVAYWAEWKTKQDEASKKDENKLVSFTPDAVKKLVIETHRENPSRTVLVLNEGKWVIAEPVNAGAEQSVVTTLIQSITDYKYESAIDQSTGRLKEFGLEPPLRTLTFGLKDDAQVVVQIGDKSPVGYSAYLKRGEQDKVLIGGQQLIMATDKKLDDIRDKTIARVKESEVVQAHLKTKKANLSFVRKSKDDPYSAVSNLKPFNADTDTVSDFLVSFSGEKAAAIIDNPPQDLVSLFSPGRRFGTLSLKTGEGQTIDFVLAEKGQDFYASSEPQKQIFKLAEGAKAKLDRDQSYFLDKTVFKFAPANVISLDIDGELYVKEGDVWKKKSDNEDAGHLQSFLVDLEFAKTDSFPGSDVAKGVTARAPQYRLKLNFKPEEKREVMTVDVWPDSKQDGMMYVRHSDSPQLYHVSSSVFANLSKKDPAGSDQAGGADLESEEEMFAPE